MGSDKGKCQYFAGGAAEEEHRTLPDDNCREGSGDSPLGPCGVCRDQSGLFDL